MADDSGTATERRRRGYEELRVGEAGILGTVDVTREAVVEFASAWDPQPFHLDEEAGRASPLGGLAASGWHTCSLVMRLLVDNLLVDLKAMGSGGIRDLKWLKPVLAGDRITARYEIVSVRPSSRGDRGYADAVFTVENQRGEQVLSMACPIIVGR
jgi:acyl dehydratase